MPPTFVTSGNDNVFISDFSSSKDNNELKAFLCDKIDDNNKFLVTPTPVRKTITALTEGVDYEIVKRVFHISTEDLPGGLDEVFLDVIKVDNDMCS